MKQNDEKVLNMIESIEDKMENYLNLYKKGLDTNKRSKFLDQWINEYKFTFSNPQDNNDFIKNIKERGLCYSFREENKTTILKHSKNIFNHKTIRNEIKVYIFIFFIEQYLKKNINKMKKGIYNCSTTKQRETTKKKNAIKGANAIIDFLGGQYSSTQKASDLKLLLKDFLKNIDEYEIKKNTFNYCSTKESLEYDLNLVINHKSKEISDFVKELI